MKKGIRYTGIPSEAELAASPGVPSAERLAQGPVAFIECVEEIPCNPCEEACPFGAIAVGEPITNLPVLDGGKCTGCGVCIAKCPGLAIFKVHLNYTETTSLVEFPYEYVPLPRKGDVVACGDREGRRVAEGRVVSVKNPKTHDGTAVVAVEVPRACGLAVRTLCRKERSAHG